MTNPTAEEEDPLLQECQARVGSVLAGKWTLEALIGVGGMAAVYAARHRNGATAAIKMLHGELAGHTELRQRFLREAYIANKVEHIGSVKVLDDDTTERGEPYLVMELLKGASVEDHAARNGGRLPLPHILNIVDQTLAVLEVAHRVGIVHRDLKPDNLFLTEEGVVKVLDFGIARLRDSAETKKTATGMLMGTPAFMAPEQALGRWQSVDGRTDLWAVGAIVFSLLSGRPVHEGETANEMLVQAATRPVPSLARVVQVPQPLVEFVDKALSFEQDRRYADAHEMRVALRAAVQGIAGAPGSSAVAAVPGVPGSSAAGAAGLGAAATVAGLGGPAAPAAGARTRLRTRGGGRAGREAEEPGLSDAEAVAILARGDAFAEASISEEDVKTLTELFVAVERALIAQVQYGKEHPETRKRFDRVFSQVASALLSRDDALAWNVTPYSFVAGEHTLWEPKSPFDRIPYQLFSDGIRLLGLDAGLTEGEFLEFLRIVTLDRAREMAPEDDFVTLIWDANFQHILHQAIDTFAEGSQDERAAFERNVEKVVKLAHYETPEQLEESWKKAKAVRSSAPADVSRRRMIALITTAERADAESRAKAVQAQMADPRLDDPVAIQRALNVDPAMLQMLGVRLQPDVNLTGERFAVAAARAYREARRRGAERAVVSPIRSAIDGLAKAAPVGAISMIGALAAGVDDGRTPAAEVAEVRAALTGAIVSKKTMEYVLDGAVAEGANQALFLEGLKSILQCVDNTHVPAALKALVQVADGPLKDALMAYLGRAARGYELELGQRFAEADVELGLALVRVLAALNTKEARDAISMAARCPHAVVRIEALGHVEGASSERLRLELRALLEDKEPGVRVAALRAMRQYGIRVAGPFLVLRIRSAEFDRLAFEEREEALHTVVALAPSRAEAVCLELLKESRVVSSEAHEQTRGLAAELLGEVAQSPEAVEVLNAAATARWKNSERVRAAATKALARIEERAAAKAAGAARRKPDGRTQA